MARTRKSRSADQARLEAESEPEGGPIDRLNSMLDERLSLPHDKSDDDKNGDEHARPRGGPAPEAAGGEEGESEEAEPPGRRSEAALLGDLRRERIAEYRARQLDKLTGEAPRDVELELAPAPPPQNNWIPIGPSVVLQGQVSNRANVSGRVAGVAVATGGMRVYAAAANGGVWRSDDGGSTWADTMPAWDLNPLTNSSDSLACGAIAIDLTNPDRVYVGSGEGDSDWSGGGTISGVGPIVSDDGGVNWATETSSPSLAGSSFYMLAVDPVDPDVVVAATALGIYRREPVGGGGFQWNRRKTGRTFSVVVAKSATAKRFYASESDAVFSSPDGVTWTAVATGFPATNVGRVALAVQPANPDNVYALAARADWTTLGVWRLDNGTGASPTWREVTGAPADLFGTAPGQGWWDIAIAVDPTDINRIYLAGSTRSSGAPGADTWSSALYRSIVSSAGSGAGLTYSMTNTAIGANVHADLHRLAITPGDSDNLWVCSDGGLFMAEDAASAATFRDRNAGLNTITCEHLSLHPTQGAVALVGGQDHGTMRYVGEEAWLHMAPGDGGYSVINWNDPYKMIVTYPSTVVRRFTDGGTRYNYTHVSLNTTDPALFYAPMVGTPVNTATPAEAERVAIGTTRPWISATFGGGWTSIPAGTTADQLGSGNSFRIRSMVFATAKRLYVGTMNGRIYRYDEAGGAWTRTRIDDDGGLPSTFAVPVTDIAVDPNDATGASIYITFGGMLNDARRVWRYDGSTWASASGTGATGLLDVQFGAVVCNPDNPTHVYVGADIGVWQSTNSGTTWQVFAEGLPDVFVMDLKTVKLSNGVRVLRASTHGRGVFERTLDSTPKQGVELYVRDTQLDEGRFATVNGLPDPAHQGETVRHWHGPDIKVDTPDAMGNYQFALGSTIDFADFVGTLTDDSGTVATHATSQIITRVYVQVHNRGVVRADGVRVTCLLANASAGLPNLPAGYDVNIRNGTPVAGPNWVTLGSVLLDDVTMGEPKIAAFDLPSSLLPPPASLAGNNHHCVLALVHHPSDQYTSTETNTDLNSIQERKAAHKNLHVVEFTGAVPAAPTIIPVRIHCIDGRPATMRINLNGYPGNVRVYFPPIASPSALKQATLGFQVGEDFDDYRVWADWQVREIGRNQRSRHPWNREFAKQRLANIERVLGAHVMLTAENSKAAELRNIECQQEGYVEFHVLVDRPARAKVGQTFPIEIVQLDAEGKEVIGALSARVAITEEPKELKYELVVKTSRYAKTDQFLLLAYLIDGNGDRVDPARVMVAVSGRGIAIPELKFHAGWRAHYALPKVATGAPLTVRATLDGLDVATTTHPV